MPSLFKSPFPSLIQQLPVLQHSESIGAEFWRPKFTEKGQADLWKAIFGSESTIRLSRERLLDYRYSNEIQKCAEILLWGYPKNLNQVVTNVLGALADVARLAPKPAPWPEYFHQLRNLGGLGISTITKFAYFYSHKFEDKRALILDMQIVAKSARWDETVVPGLSWANGDKNYLTYLHTMHGVAAQMACAADQIEFFIFTFGNTF